MPFANYLRKGKKGLKLNMNQYLELGQIVNVKGLKGEVKVNSFSEDSQRFEKISEVILKIKNK